ncbi:unnamed protein product [Adineta ricciae]|uniref:VCBS repeat-containing protein n=2 Tax=Adineta ricciae TaxID=249248 RepID=A0A815REN0_ADIRI|nr:unnamed protein product [Adineta ricciae]
MSSRFSINTPIAVLMKNLFIEEWITSINYSSYFEQCFPLFCSYTYIRRFSLLYAITFVLGIQGGLTIILKWICPQIVRIVFKINYYQNSRRNIVQSMDTTRITTIGSTNTVIPDRNFEAESISRNVTSQVHIHRPVRRFVKMFSILSLALFVLLVLIMFSIYVARSQSDEIIRTVSLTNTTNYAYGTMITSTPESTATLNFTTTDNWQYGPRLPIGIDFNNDGILDLVFIGYHSLRIMFGNGNGTFQGQTVLLTISEGLYIVAFALGDFNKDGRLDVAVINSDQTSINVLLSDNNGTFGDLMQLTGDNIKRLEDITIADFDNDNYLDIAVCDFGNNAIGVLFNNVVGHKQIGVLFGYGNRTFQSVKTFFTGGGYRPTSFVMGDFNEDTWLDVAYSCMSRNAISVLFGYSNETLGGNVDFFIETDIISTTPPAIGDLNNDGHLDIVVPSARPDYINILIGRGNGIFIAQHIFVPGTSYNEPTTKIIVHDFNGDSCQDLIVSTYFTSNLDILLNNCDCSVSGISRNN